MTTAMQTSPVYFAPKSPPSIAEFFKGRSVLITGGTGYIGKAIVEKLLHSCPGVKKLYLLVRPKKGLDPQERVKRLIEQTVFNRLRASEGHSGWQEKMVAVAGDVTADGLLGLSEEDRKELTDEVSVFFHCAATVRFDDTLLDAVKMNVRGTLRALQLAMEMKNLKVMAHVSTAYCHTERRELDEALYPPPAEWRDIIWATENLSSFELSAITHKIVGKLPNTYGFTKGLSEQVVYEYRHKLPLFIYRPSIVTSAIQEPLPGWLDNFNGPVGLLIASGKGVVRTVLLNESFIADYCPVDVCVKGVIGAAWYRATSSKFPALTPQKEVIPEVIPEEGLKDPLLPVFNCATSGVKPVTFGEVQEMGRWLTAETPFNTILWYPGGYATTSVFLYHILMVLFHLIPAIIFDTGLWLTGQKTRLWRLHRRIYTANKAVKYYLLHQWKFHSKAFIELNRELILEKDRELFALDISAIDKVEYFRNAILGGRRYLLNEPDSTLPAAKANLQRMYILDRSARLLLVALLLFFLWPHLRSLLFFV
ncbi:fatty acyl-CoA reductase 1-like isoform X2 [Ischnura elegans]|nr:fatty acyl-CoA reductase 1-like isoform X2 [Ischnura elegans]XP_046382884.1 fatty acyl-CoA reductase 1-like isoform X2 [Ischnura elegans]